MAERSPSVTVPKVIRALLHPIHWVLDTCLHRRENVSWVEILGFRVGLSAAAVLLLADARQSPGVLAVIAVAFALTSLAIARVLPISKSLDHQHAARIAFFSFVALVAGGLVVFVGWNDSGGTAFSLVRSATTFAGLAAMFLGAGTLTVLLRRVPWLWLVATVAAVASIASLVLGVHGLGGASSAVPLTVAAGGLLLAPIAMGLFGELLISAATGGTPPPGTFHRRTAALLAIAGGSAVVISLVLLLTTTSLPGADIQVTFVALGLLALLTFLITIRPSIDTVFVVIMLAASWANAPRSVPASSTPALVVGTGNHVFVALGDSYISGEGATRFYAGTNVKGSNQCRRAPTAYSPLLAEHRAPSQKPAGEDAIPAEVIFLACSGAVADNLDLKPQYSGDPVDGPRVLQPDGTYAPGETQLAQLRKRLDATRAVVDFTLVGVGGNDVGFGDIVQTCLAPGDCSIFADRWNERVDALAPTLDRAYRAIGQTMPNGRIIVVPYPIPVSDRQDCTLSTYTLDERRFLAQFTAQLDDVIVREAKRHGFLVAETRNALQDANARLCDVDQPSKVGVNWVALKSVEGQLQQAINPQNWFHDSMHPNKLGHEVIASGFAAWLNSAPTQSALAAKTAYVDPGPLPTVAASKPCSRCPSYCADTSLADTSCEHRWAFAQIGAVLVSGQILLLLLWIAGAWLLACVVISCWRATDTA